MPARRAPKDPVTDKLDEILIALQNLFILEALRAGMKVGDIRTLLKINMWRVSNISKHLKEERSRGNRR